MTRRRALRFVNWIKRNLPLLSLDVRVAEVHAPIWTALYERGDRIDAHDLLIAATAIARKAELITAEKKMFEKIARVSALRMRIYPAA